VTHVWRIGDAALAVLGGFAAGTLALVALGTTDPTPFEAFGIVLPLQEGVTFALFWWLAHRRGATAPLGELGIPPRFGDAWLIGIGLVLAVVAAVALTQFADIEEAPQEIARLADEAAGFTALLASLGTVLAAPLVEEIIFRGVLLRGLQHYVPFAAAVIASSAAFAVFHYNGPDTVVVLPPLFLLGVILAVTAHRRGVGAAVYIHSGFNLLAALSFLV
jgi:membrane protease YdiL (CAAX protease family)